MDELKNFSTGVKRFRVGENVFSFVPTDIGLYGRFLKLKDRAEEMGNTLEADYERLNIKEANFESAEFREYTELTEKSDKKLKAEMALCFGERLNNDFDAIFDGVNIFSIQENGLPIIFNFLVAIEPIIRKEISESAKNSAKATAQAMKKYSKR